MDWINLQNNFKHKLLILLKTDTPRSYSNTRNKLNTVQSQTPNDPINFEILMYHPTEMAKALTPTSCFYLLYGNTHVTQSNVIFHHDWKFPSFWTVVHSSILVLHYSTYTILQNLSIWHAMIHSTRQKLYQKQIKQKFFFYIIRHLQ